VRHCSQSAIPRPGREDNHPDGGVRKKLPAESSPSSSVRLICAADADPFGICRRQSPLETCATHPLQPQRGAASPRLPLNRGRRHCPAIRDRNRDIGNRRYYNVDKAELESQIIDLAIRNRATAHLNSPIYQDAEAARERDDGVLKALFWCHAALLVTALHGKSNSPRLVPV